MKTLITSLKKYFPVAVLLATLLILSSCATQNQKYNNADGIYDSEDEIISSNPSQEIDKTNYYQQYFKSKAGTYEGLPEEGAIFTDIEAYSTTDTLDEDGYIVTEENYQEEGYGEWGSNSENITVNVYNGGGYGIGGYGYGGYGYGGWGFNFGWMYPSFWGPNYGWGRPYYGGFYCPPYYGGYYNPYHHNGYGYGNNIAYNRGRRNTNYTAGVSNYRNRSNSRYRGRNSYSRAVSETKKQETNKTPTNSNNTSQ
jgi:hypothetical protein